MSTQPQIIDCQDPDKDKSIKSIADNNKVVKHSSKEDHWSDTFIERVQTGHCPICGISLSKVHEVISVIPPSEIVCFDVVDVCIKHPGASWAKR